MANVHQVDLEPFSIGELEELVERIQGEIETKRERIKAELLEELGKKAEAAGLTVEQVLGKQGRAPKRKSSAVVKYRNPGDSSQTWSGKGRKPAWLKDALQAGTKLEDLLIEKST